MLQKVVICGVDTSGLPLLSSKEQEELLVLLEKLSTHCKDSGLDERMGERRESDCRGNGRTE